MKKIAIVMPSSLPAPNQKGGAIETLITNLLDENEKSSHSFEFVVLNNNVDVVNCSYNKSKIVKISYNTTVGKLYKLFFLAINKIFKYRFPKWDLYLKKSCEYIKKMGVDEVLVEGLPQQCQSIYYKTKIKPILHLHTDLLYEGINNSDKIVLSCKRIICVSNYIQSRVLTIKQSHITNVVSVLNCVDTSAFNPEMYNRYRLRQREILGYTNEDFVILFSGRICEEKGVGDLLQAYLNLRIPNKKLLLVGGSNFGDSIANNFYNSILSVAKKYKDITMTGFVKHENMPEMLSACDVYVSPSRYYEAAPLANLEAICMGIPAVVSDRGGITEYTNKNCVIINVDNNAERNIIHAVQKIYSDRECFSRLPSIDQWSSKRYFDELTKEIDYL